METCLICNKHNGTEALPPGEYIYEDQHWMVCHAPVKSGPLGTLFIESKRHFLDFAEFNLEEQSSYGEIASKVSAALKQLTDATRIYHLSTVEGVPHFHVWLIPRRQDIPERSLAFLSRDDSCNEEDAITFADKLREALKK
jgi:diadenosine tetraphosphate (Ap4A) HIT family hydrolase